MNASLPLPLDDGRPDWRYLAYRRAELRARGICYEAALADPALGPCLRNFARALERAHEHAARPPGRAV